MKCPVIIIGNGGHARVLVSILDDQGYYILGYTAPQEEGSRLTYLGEDDVIESYDPNDIMLVNGVGSTKIPELRKQLFEYFKHKGYQFLSVIHNSAIISSSVQLGEGVQIMAGSVLQPESSIGHNSIVNTKASVDHDCRIGSHAHLAPGVVLSGEVIIGDQSLIGTGTSVIHEVKIGHSTIIGAGSVVVQNVSDNKKVYGVPAKER
ncbi:acetyltransferase [Salibacterium lacus]|uniref:Acetyltransferase n=1 Tax=Salibacterium lacus TaxID=1898109 RepID=A0ABW5T1K4_9BACI